jgi:hypothetical protein
MRLLKLAGVLGLLLMIGATAAATASATPPPEFLPGNAKEVIKGKSGAVTLQIKGGTAISCKGGSELKGELLSTKTAAVTTTFKECTAAGLAINSVGAPAKTIVVGWLLILCLLAGVNPIICYELFQDNPTKLEVPSTKTTLTLEGGFLGQIEPVGKKLELYTTIVTQKEGVQGIEKAEGEEAQSLKTSVNGGAFTQTGIEMKEASLEFEKGKPQELMS